jgi:hypothetical protein
MPHLDDEEPKRPGPHWNQTAWGQVMIGLILAQGLFYGLRHLLTGILLAASGTEPQALWEDMGNLLLLQAIQMLSVFAGGMLAAGGRQQGFFLGTMVGAWNGILSVLLRQNPAQELTPVVLYGQPLLHAAFGALGGWVGAQVWQPIQPAADVLLGPQRQKPLKRRRPFFAGRISWLRIVAGSALAVLGTLYATMLFRKVLEASGGALGTSHQIQDRLITWEIKALAAIVGGALAGASTRNGLKQGVFVGLFSSMVVIALQAPIGEDWFGAAALILATTIPLTMAGGWFGGQLFPPIVKNQRRGIQTFV